MLIVTYLSHTYNNYDITIGKSGEGGTDLYKTTAYTL